MALLSEPEGTVKTDAQGIAEVSFKADESTVENDRTQLWRSYQNPKAR